MKLPTRLSIFLFFAITAFLSFLAFQFLFAESGKVSWQVPEEKANVVNPIPADDTSISLGKSLYARECLSCHGVSGIGDGPAASTLEKKVPDISGNKLDNQTDGAIFYKTTVGRRPMPSYRKTLTEEERWHIVNYLRTFSEKKK